LIIAQSPLRISFCGGGSDFEEFYLKYGGAVLSTAIDKYVYVIVKERFDDKIVLNYREREIVDDVKDIKHDLIRESMILTGVGKGIEITTLADIPSEGTGLGSSSSITVGLLQALFAYQNEVKTQKELADLACKIEIEILHKPIGCQDQVIASFGGFRFIDFGKEIKVQSVKVDKHRFSDNLMMFYTGITRQSSDVLADQKANISQRIEVLCEMRNLAHLGRTYLELGEYDEFARLLGKNWELKKKLSQKISTSQIDEMYDMAIKAGAISGKVTGAGAGGFLLLYVNPNKQNDVRKALHSLRELPFAMEYDGTKIIFNHRRK
jgi:D-glycero-alpha-D-manno-heptose-7-phosphate kinase